MSETIDGLRNKFLKWKEAYESKGRKVNLGKTKLDSVGIAKDGLYKSKVFHCCVCSFRVKANTVFCVQCDKWINNRCTAMKRLTPERKKNGSRK